MKIEELFESTTMPNNPHEAYKYALKHGPCKQCERVIIRDYTLIPLYVKNVLKERWKIAEPLLKDYSAMEYALYTKVRLPQVEESIFEDLFPTSEVIKYILWCMKGQPWEKWENFLLDTDIKHIRNYSNLPWDLIPYYDDVKNKNWPELDAAILKYNYLDSTVDWFIDVMDKPAWPELKQEIIDARNKSFDVATKRRSGSIDTTEYDFLGTLLDKYKAVESIR